MLFVFKGIFWGKVDLFEGFFFGGVTEISQFTEKEKQ